MPRFFPVRFKSGPTFVFVFFLFGYVFQGCRSGTTGEKNAIPTDSATITSGRMIFIRNCASCHGFGQDGIGPTLGGIAEAVAADWLLRFIKHPQQVIASGDKRADSLFKRFKSVMPSFDAIPEKDLLAVLAFLKTHGSSRADLLKEHDGNIADPIPEKIKFSGLTANLVPVTQFPPSAAPGKFPKTRITKLAFSPGSGDLFVNDLRGKLYKLKNNVPRVYLDLPRLKPQFIDEPGLATGFGSFAFHPDFIKNGLFYTTHTEKPGSGKSDFTYPDSIKVEVQWVLTEWKASNPAADTFSGTSRELLRINMVSGAHGVQEITFDPLAKPGSADYGLLYIGVGDGASVQEGYPFIPHAKNKIWGSIIRIDPLGKNSANGKYGIPATNPFAREKTPGIVKEIYAYGFRNPHRITWTRSGLMLASHIGQSNLESIYLIRPGRDYGWPIREGNFLFNPYGNLNHVYPLPANDSLYKITYPIASFDHDEGNAISGGYEYWGANIQALKGKFLFGDIPSGRLFYIDLAAIGKKVPVTVREWKITIDGVPETLKKVCGSDRVDLRFGRDAKGDVYILTKSDGRLYKISGAVMESQK
ncbi:MAG: PQQ-dependent sugar dehydrogenase [Puia sp.]